MALDITEGVARKVLFGRVMPLLSHAINLAAVAMCGTLFWFAWVLTP